MTSLSAAVGQPNAVLPQLSRRQRRDLDRIAGECLSAAYRQRVTELYFCLTRLQRAKAIRRNALIITVASAALFVAMLLTDGPNRWWFMAVAILAGLIASSIRWTNDSDLTFARVDLDYRRVRPEFIGEFRTIANCLPGLSRAVRRDINRPLAQ